MKTFDKQMQNVSVPILMKIITKKISPI